MDTESLVHRLGDLFRPFVAHGSFQKDAGYMVVVGPVALGGATYPERWLCDGFFAGDGFRSLLSAAQRQPQKLCLLKVSSSWWPQAGHENVERARSPTDPRERSHSYLLVIKEIDEHSHMQVALYALLLANRRHIEHGGLCLHSAAVAQGNSGFLFLGQSEAGKTTVAQLGVELGHAPLGDDLNFIIRDGKGGYLLAAGPSMVGSPIGYNTAQRPSLVGIFNLVQDSRDYLSPVSPQQMAHDLFHALLQTPKTRHLSEKIVGLAFQTCCDIARRIPGYELHFRKSPDFWKLVDEQFPG